MEWPGAKVSQLVGQYLHEYARSKPNSRTTDVCLKNFFPIAKFQWPKLGQYWDMELNNQRSH